jgi:Winged helix DNA-binding domain
VTPSEIIRLRLHHQQVSSPGFKQPAELVRWMGAMQAQEYAMAKWAVGLRLPDSSDDAIEAAFNAGEILRTHVLRPTWHFVHPADIRWLLRLSAPRVNAVNAYMYRQCELDQSVFRRSHAVLAKALAGNTHLTRNELSTFLARRRIRGDGVRLSCLMMRAELDGIICSGPRKGRQFTYALLDERVAPARSLDRTEALAALTERYFASRGPATVTDFSWWSGLTLKEARAGVESLPGQFIRETIADQQLVFLAPNLTRGRKRQPTLLLPAYDEYGMAYRDRRGLFHLQAASAQPGQLGTLYYRMAIANGLIVGGWRPIAAHASMGIEIKLLANPAKAQLRALRRAAEQYCAFSGNTLGSFALI